MTVPSVIAGSQIRSIVIDDESDAQDVVFSYAARYCPELKMIGRAGGVQEGLKQISLLKPQLIFLDISMADGSGFDVIESRQCDFEVIFTTAFDQFAIKAFKYAAVDYLLKPIDPDDFMRAVRKVKSDKAAFAVRVGHLIRSHHSENCSTILLTAIGMQQEVEINSIIRIESDSRYSTVYLTNGRSYTMSRLLKEFEEMLPAHWFVRVHQSHLVNITFVQRFSDLNGGSILMCDSTIIPISRRRRDEITSLLAI